MAQVFFDTLKFVETLEAAGVPAAQARAFSAAVKESHEAAEVATKADLAEVKRDIVDLHKEMDNRFDMVDARIERLSLQLTVKFGSMLAAAVTILGAIIKFSH